MRLLTQNLLVCNKRVCQTAGVVNFPLQLIVNTWNDFDDDSAMPCTRPLMAKLVEKVDWNALRQTVSTVSKSFIYLLCLDIDTNIYVFLQLDWGIELPETFEENMLDDENAL